MNRNVKKQNGYYEKELGSYTLTKLPKIGNYEYILQNDSILVKVDQFGISSVQLFPPYGIAIFKREKRENVSPIRTYFNLDDDMYHNFDVYHATKICIKYTPSKLSYILTFKDLDVVTDLFVAYNKPVIFYNVSFVSHKKDFNLKVLNVSFYHMQEFMMAMWDKPEWYLKTSYINNKFIAKRLSIEAKKEERHILSLLSSKKNESISISYEKLISLSNNLTTIPTKLDNDGNELYGFEQCFASIFSLNLKKSNINKVKFVYSIDENNATKYLLDKNSDKELKLLDKKFNKLFNVKNVETNDKDFNQFVNGFLPLELSWVNALDRGWPTMMRGTRDASNDSLGYLDYDLVKCKETIKTILMHQRSDGWYPRQFGVIDLNKNDLRDFIDSGLFFFEFLYRYLCYSNDFDLLKENIRYLDNPKEESVFKHLERGIDFYLDPKHIGEHGICKLEGGDWLDALRGAGIKGIGESVMVSSQLIIALNEWVEILNHIKISNYQKYLDFAKKLKDNINKCSLNKEGYYNAIYTDDKKWILSLNDYDNKDRVYVPTNAYAILSDVATKPSKVIDCIEKNKTPVGYTLFNHPLGETYLPNIGKMGSGDFPAYLFENGSVYNHGSQCFYLLAIAKLKDYDRFGEVLKYVLPYKRDENQTGSASYTITNCYQLIPSMYGRSAFAFLTGSVSMIEIIIYQAMFGIKYDFDNLIIDPCLPKEFKDSKVTIVYRNKKILINYRGYGKAISPIKINKDKLTNNFKIDVSLTHSIKIKI